MELLNLALQYIIWHYTKALSGLFQIWGNFFWFLVRFFSMPTMVRTLFSPWKRIHEERGRASFNIGRFFSALVVNTIMRIIGFVFRILLLLSGVVSLALVLFILVATFILWILAPFILAFTFLSGIILLFK